MISIREDKLMIKDLEIIEKYIKEQPAYYKKITKTDIIRYAIHHTAKTIENEKEA